MQWLGTIFGLQMDESYLASFNISPVFEKLISCIDKVRLYLTRQRILGRSFDNLDHICFSTYLKKLWFFENMIFTKWLWAFFKRSILSKLYKRWLAFILGGHSQIMTLNQGGVGRGWPMCYVIYEPPLKTKAIIFIAKKYFCLSFV